jgi:acyl dehydratase
VSGRSDLETSGDNRDRAAAAEEPSGVVHDAREGRFGRLYEDLVPGERFRHWPGKTVTEADDHLFCMLTMAASPVHVDANFAAQEMAGGQNIVLGTYVYSLVAGMSVADLSGRAVANLGVESLRHLAAVHHGDTLYAHSIVVSRRRSRSQPALGVVTVKTWGENQLGERVIEFQRSFLVPSREEVG